MDNQRVESIKLYMKKNKITYEKLAIKANMSIGTIKSIFSGRTVNPRLDTMQAIESALQLTPSLSPSKPLTRMQQELINVIPLLSDEQAQIILDVIRRFK